jgi:DNA modification methylase
VSVSLFQGRCEEVLPALPDASVDTLITDPPYALTDLAWDKKFDLAFFWQQVNRVCREDAVMVLFSQQPFTTDLISSNRAAFRYELIWHKSNAVGWLSARRRPLRAHENVLVFARRFRGSIYRSQMSTGFKPYRTLSREAVPHYGKQRMSTRITQSSKGERYPRSVLHFSNRNSPSLHPTQKPLALMEWLVKTYSEEGCVVLDPFMGSGSTGVACANNGRSFIGIEQDEAYFKVARRRLDEAGSSVSAEP